MSRTCAEKLASARAYIRGSRQQPRAPYALPVVYLLQPVESEGLMQRAGGPLATTQRAVMLYDPAWVATTEIPVLAFGLLHEALHLWMRHFARVGARDPRLWNLAGDLAINPMCRDALKIADPLPGIWPQQLGWDEGLSADEYYERLSQQAQQQPQPKPGEPGAGACGSCAHGGDEDGGEDAERSGADSTLGRSEGAIERAGRAAAEAAQEQARRFPDQKKAGSVPASLVRECGALLAPPKVRWQEVLRRRVTRGAAATRGRADYSRSRVSRRQAAYGWQGVPLLPAMIAPEPRVCVVADTSGSMSGADLARILAETQGILRTTGLPIDWLAADAEVAVSARGVRRIQQVRLAGGGGTDFRPAIEEAQQLRADVCVYMTDGFGVAPDAAPRGMRVIWLLIGSEAQKPCAWGEVIHVD